MEFVFGVILGAIGGLGIGIIIFNVSGLNDDWKDDADDDQNGSSPQSPLPPADAPKAFTRITNRERTLVL